MAFDIGDVNRLRVRFYDNDPASGTYNQLVDPTAVNVEVKPPNVPKTQFTTVTNPQVIRESLGVYRLDYPCAVSGRHFVKGNGTGANAAAEQDFFDVRASAVDA